MPILWNITIILVCLAVIAASIGSGMRSWYWMKVAKLDFNIAQHEERVAELNVMCNQIAKEHCEKHDD